MSISEILFGFFLISTVSIMLMSSVVMFMLTWEDLKDAKRRKKK